MNTLDEHEADFTNAYKGQMLKVKRELQHLKDKADEAERELMQNDLIMSLRNSISWFKGEALKLDETLEN
jgi:hypothetical protein